jgi:hypothetical protein
MIWPSGSSAQCSGRAMADRVRLIPWPETYEVRHPDGTRTFFRFDDENSLRRTLMGRTTKAEAIRRGVWVVSLGGLDWV